MGIFQGLNRVFLLAIVLLSAGLGACSSGGSGKGSPTTGTGDTRPEPFTLEAPAGVDLTKVDFDTAIISAPVTVTGIDTAAPVSINGGEYSIGAGAFTATSGTITNGQTIRVRLQSPIKAEQSAVATLNIGGETAALTVTTDTDTIPPEVSILFPPPASMTEGQTLFLRGTIKDVNGTLEERAVTVNGMAADLNLNDANDEGTWEATVNLAPGENTVTISALDTAENVNDEESVSSRRVASIAGESFPDNQNPFGASINADIGWEDGKPVAYVTDDTALKVFRVDLTDGARTVLAGNDGVDEELIFEEPWGIHLGSNGKLYVSDVTRGAIFELDLDMNTRTLVAASNAESFWDSPTGMQLINHQGEQRLYVGDGRGKIFWIDLASKVQTPVTDSRVGLQPGGELYPNVFGLGFFNEEQTIFAAATNGIFSVDLAGGGESPVLNVGIAAISSIASTDYTDQIFFVNNDDDSVHVLDLQTEESSVVAGGSENSENQPLDIWGISANPDLGYLLLVDRMNGLMAMDYESLQTVVISKSASVAP